MLFLLSFHLLCWSEFLRRLTTPLVPSLAVVRVNTGWYMEKYVNGYQSIL